MKKTEFRALLEAFPDQSPQDRAYIRLAVDRLWLTLQHLPSGTGVEHLLDVGSGSGLLGPAYIRLWHYGSVSLLGYDVPPNGLVERTDASGRRYQFATYRANIELDRFSLADACIDTIVCTDVLEHLIFDPMFAMSEMNRVLKPGGHALIAVPNAVSDEVLMFLINNRQPGFLRHYLADALVAGDRNLSVVYNLGHFHEYTASELAALARAAGFEVEKLTSINYREPEYNDWRSRLFRRLTAWMWPHAPRLRGEELVGVFRKTTYVPLESHPNRYPSPLYGWMSKCA